MIDCGDGAFVDEQGHLCTAAGAPIWMTRDGRLVPVTQLAADHLAAIRSWLHAHRDGRETWIAQVEGEVARRERHHHAEA